MNLEAGDRQVKERLAQKRLKETFLKQEGRCFYCERLTVLGKSSRDGFEALKLAQMRQEAARDWGFVDWSFVPHARRRAMLATCEHLQRRADGGTWASDNIVMACNECNSNRQDTPVEQYKQIRSKVKEAI